VVNGRTVANGTYFGVEMGPLVEGLVGERLADGGWNCEVERGSVRSSFDSTINFRSASALTGAAPDPRLGETIEHLRSRRLDDGAWPLDRSPTARVWFDVDDGAGNPSRWVTLRAMRVLRWWEGQIPTARSVAEPGRT
jgi:hypothetical protein